MDMAWPGFDEELCRVGQAKYLVEHGGAGSPVLLLHGFPQTHHCWHRVAAALASMYYVVAPDLRGYGASTAPPPGPRGEGYTKREMAADMVHVMQQLGYDRFAVVGHDRGARVAFRLALDHPQGVSCAAMLNIVPTLDQFVRMGDGPSLSYWPWFLLATPAPLPERLLGADPDAVLDHAFDTWSDRPEAIEERSRVEYRRAMTPATIAAICGDYRASFHLDREHDAGDRHAGRRITAPVLVVTGDAETQLADASDVWRTWTVELDATTVPGGHFIPEEAPLQLVERLLAFLPRGAHPRGE
jgi:haloacetate dehalogenase